MAKSLEELIEEFWNARADYHVFLEGSNEAKAKQAQIAHEKILQEIVGSLRNFADVERAKEFANSMQFTHPHEGKYFTAIRDAADMAEKIKDDAQATAHFFARMQDIATNFVRMSGGAAAGGAAAGGTIAGGTIGGAGTIIGGGGTVIGGGSGPVGGLFLIAFALAAGANKARAQNAPPDPKVLKYQEYLIGWLFYATKTLANNKGNIKMVNKPKTFQQWLKKPGI